MSKIPKPPSKIFGATSIQTSASTSISTTTSTSTTDKFKPPPAPENRWKSTLNLNKINFPTSTHPISARSALSRRSKSFAVIRRPLTSTLRSDSALNINKKPTTGSATATFKQPVKQPVKLPVKRPGLPTNGETKEKVSKPNPPKPKPAPYDYKARFALLKEQYDKLKASVAEKEENLATFSEENVTLKNERDTLKSFKEKYEVLLEENVKIKPELNEAKKELKKIKKALEDSDKENNHLKVENQDLREKILKKNSQLASLSEINLSISHDIEKEKHLVSELRIQCQKLDHEKRKIHNDLQDLKGNIRVFCRVRPQLQSENNKFICDINYVDEKTLELSRISGKESIDPKSGRPRGNKQEFSFDRVFNPLSSQEEIFFELSQLCQSVLDGYNVCVFAYGQTGSGKTYTMEGYDNETSGMIPRSVDLIFKSMEDLKLIGWEYTIKASFLEIYNETIVDLLSTEKKTHEIKMSDAKGSDVYVTNLTVDTIKSASELKKKMKIAQQNRAVACTENNERSSRSHSVTKILLKGRNLSRNENCLGSLNLVDLAGSEKMHSDEATRMAETKNINRSLANLGNVILALVKGQDHIPYRNSKLTYLLMPCLGGNSKTLMLVNVSPFEECYNETVNSLRFASQVNQCKTGNVKKNKTIQNSITPFKIPH